MASPFRVFRKHQKILIATLGVMAIVAFVFLGTIQQIQGSRAPEDQVVVTTTKYGDLTESQLQAMMYRQQRAGQFLVNAVSMAGQVPADEASRQQLNSVLQLFGKSLMSVLDRSTDDNPVTEEGAVQFWLLRQRAAELGLEVDDRVITRFLRDATSNRVGNDQFAGLYQQMGVSESEIFNILHDALLVQALSVAAQQGMMAATPAQAWEYFQRLERSVDVEVVPVAVDQFVDKAPDPSEAELKAFFEKHKNEFAYPGSSEPGFRVPEKVALEYFTASYEDFSKSASVSDAEVKEYYEKNRELYRNVILPGAEMLENVKPTTPDKTPPSGDKKDEKAKDAEKDATPAKSDGKKPAEKKSDEKKPNASSSKPSSTDGAATPWANASVRLVADEKEKDAKKDATPVKSDEKKTDAAAKTADAKKPGDPKAKKPEYKPLDEVKDEIRQDLADVKAKERIREVLAKVEAKMKDYRSQRKRYDLRSDEQKGEPPTIDMKALAKEHGLSLHRTELVNDNDLYETEVGKSYETDRLLGLSGASALETIFRRLNDFQPGKSCDMMQTKYFLFWRTAHSDERVPSFDDKGVREEALGVWKRIQARDLAKKHAEQLAEEARKSGKSLALSLGVRPGVKVTQTGPFTWLHRVGPDQYGRIGFRANAVPEVKWAGEEFMRTVYGLSVGKIAVAMDQPQAVAYVVRLVETSPTEEVLWRLFTGGNAMVRGTLIEQQNTSQMGEAWINELRENAGLKWERPALVERRR